MVRVLLVAIVAAGCGGRCKEVAAVRMQLTSRTGAVQRSADVEVLVPFARANALVAELLVQQPLTVPLELPALPELGVAAQTVTATVRSAVMLPGSPGHVRFAMQLDLADPDHLVTTVDATAEVEPVLTRANGAAELSIALGPNNVTELRPTLGAEAEAKLGDAIARHLPAKLHNKVPQVLLDAAAAKLGSHLTGAAWSLLQKTLLVKLGEVTTLRLRLPDVPVAHVAIRSQPDLLVVDIASDLPVRAGLSPLAAPPSEVTVRIAGSAAAELANWALDRGHLPQWYTRGLEPRPDGEYRPRFDYVARTAHPLKVFSFQERGGCSYLKIGVTAELAIDRGALVVTTTDRELEASEASIAIEVGAWVKLFVTGAIDESKRVAAHTRLQIGGRMLDTSVVSAALAHDELGFGLKFAAP